MVGVTEIKRAWRNRNLKNVKASQRLFLIRKLKGFGVSQDVLERVYSSLVESILKFNMTVWYGNLSVRSKTKLTRIVNTASEVIGRPQAHLSSLFHRTNKKKALVVVGDYSHPLRPQVEKLQNAHGQE